MRFRACALVVGLSGLALLRPVAAADAPVDEGLLEFLGSVDSEDSDWHDYLSGTDIDQVARGAGHATPVQPPSTPPADASESVDPAAPGDPAVSHP